MKYLFFSPYNVIDDWRYSERLLQDSLSTKKDEVRTISCSSIFKENCIAIEAHTKIYKTKFIKDLICTRCIKNKKFYKGDNINYNIDDYISEKDHLKINKILKFINKKNFLKFSYHKFKIGKIALFENFLKNKKNNFVFKHNEYEEIKKSIKNILFLYFALEKIVKDYSPDIVISQNGNYSLSKFFSEYFNKRGAYSYAWEASNNYHDRFGRIFICKNDMNSGFNYLKNNWKKIQKKQKFFYKDLLNVRKHMFTIMNAKALRSFSKSYNKSEKSIREIYQLKDDKKIVLVATSSWDEVIGTYVLKGLPFNKLMIFKDQIDWIRNIIDFFSKNEKYFLIIRVHPRDANNKNSLLVKFLNKYENLPKNIKINLPSDKISLYSIFKNCDLVLNGWSTLGIEAGYFNIPLISITDELTIHPKELEKYSNNKKKYFLNIKKILDSKDRYSFDLSNYKNFIQFIACLTSKSDFNLNLKKNNFLYKTVKAFDKISFFLGIKSFHKSFLYKDQELTENQRLINFFSKRKNLISEIQDNNRNKILGNKDYYYEFKNLINFLDTNLYKQEIKKSIIQLKYENLKKRNSFK